MQEFLPAPSGLAGPPDVPDIPPPPQLPPSPGTGWSWPPLTDAGHAGHVQAVATEAVAGEALGDAHAAAVGAAIQDPALLCLQSLVGPRQGACGERGVSAFHPLNLQRGAAPLAGYPLLNCESGSGVAGGAVGPGFPRFALPLSSSLSWSAGVFLSLFITALRRSLRLHLCFPISLSQ